MPRVRQRYSADEEGSGTHLRVPTVYVVDDDMEVCRAMARLLRSPSYRVRTFVSAADFLEILGSVTAGCIILDLSMPKVDGLAVQQSLASSGCRRPIIFLTGAGSIATSVTAMRNGAVNYLTKPVDSPELLAAVNEALRIDDCERRAEAMRYTAAARLQTLTRRERQVLELVIAGRRNKQIAAELGTVEKTVKVHRARAMHKMGAGSLVQLLHVAACAGIGSAPPREESEVPADQNAEAVRMRTSGPVLRPFGEWLA